MALLTWRQLHGVNELVQGAVEATTDAVAEVDRDIFRWPYAVPLSTYPERYLLSVLTPPLAFAGDAFDGPRVEGAVLSGLAAAGALFAGLS